MFGIGFGELALILLVVVVFINPKDLPAFFRKVGRAWGELRSLSDKVKDAARNIDIEHRDKEE